MADEAPVVSGPVLRMLWGYEVTRQVIVTPLFLGPRASGPSSQMLPRGSNAKFGGRKKNFELDRWASVGCKAKPSTPCSPLPVGSR
eukprot:scaffold45696_cov53-Cyclotella_meneghiniana.AAC.1